MILLLLEPMNLLASFTYEMENDEDLKEEKAVRSSREVKKESESEDESKQKEEDEGNVELDEKELAM